VEELEAADLPPVAQMAADEVPVKYDGRSLWPSQNAKYATKSIVPTLRSRIRTGDSWDYSLLNASVSKPRSNYSMTFNCSI
jgi:hypothetical protein